MPASVRSLVEQIAHAVEELQSALAPDPSQAGSGDLRHLPRTVAIETVLTRLARPLRPVEIWAALREAGRTGDPKMEVQVTTYDLWKRGRIRRVDRGLYAAPESTPVVGDRYASPGIVRGRASRLATLDDWDLGLTEAESEAFRAALP